MKRSPDNQINASFIDISRIKWLVFYCGCLFSAQLVPLQAPKHRPIISPRPVEQTAFRRDIKDNGYKSVFTDSWLVRQRNRSWIKGLGKRLNLFIDSSAFYPFIRGPRTMSPRTPRNTCVYTRHPSQCHGHMSRVDTAPGKTRKKMECVLRRPPIGS